MSLRRKFLEKNKSLLDQAGFTLLEVLIAMAIMTVALSSILAVESGSINASARAKQMNIVAMLVKNQMIKTEYDIEGKTFDEVEKEKTEAFEAPYETYTWKRVVKEITFPTINPGSSDPNDTSVDQNAETMAKTISQFLSKAIREVDVSVNWKKDGKDQSFTVATYWVDLNHAFDAQQE
jgi:type II secretion system protein I